MRILFHSNAPWAPTGYGNQVGLFAKPLAEHHDLSISAFYGLEGARLNWEGIPVYPNLGGEYGNVGLVEHATRFFGEPRDGTVLTLIDVWVLAPQMAAQLNMACWAPVDHDPATPRTLNFFRQSGAIPIAMSRFGQERLAEFDPLYVPHGVDTEVFCPKSKAEVRKATGVDEDAFLIGMVAANKGRPSRKSFQEALQAFAIFRKSHDNAFLYLHTVVDPDFSQGVDIGAMMVALELPEGSVLIADQYRMAFNPQTSALMARIYSTFDVLLNPAQGEGFGIPILEAAACGVPAIVTNFSAMKEVCGAGWKVGYRPRWTTGNAWQATPDVDEIVTALEECYSLTDKQRRAMAVKARTHALGYDVKRVMDERFLPVLEQVEERFEARKPVELEVAA